MTAARCYVLLAITLVCHVESAMHGSLWLTTQPALTLLCDPRGQAKSLFGLQCDVSEVEGSTVVIRWYNWEVGGSRERHGGGGKRLLKTKQCTIGTEGTANSTLPLSGVSSPSGCYSCQAEVRKTHHRVIAASNPLCFGGDRSGTPPPCTRAPPSAEVQLPRSRAPPSVLPLTFHSVLRRATSEGAEGTDGLPSRLTAVYIGTGVSTVFSISILVLAVMICGLCRRRHVRNTAGHPAAVRTATNGRFVESSRVYPVPPLRMSAFSRTQSDGDLARLAIRGVPRHNSETEITRHLQRHRRRSEADSRDEAHSRSDRSRSPYRIPLNIIPGPLTGAGPPAGAVDNCLSAIAPPCRNDAGDRREEKAGHLYVRVVDARDGPHEGNESPVRGTPTGHRVCDGQREGDEGPVRAKPLVCHRRSYSEVTILPREVVPTELFDDPKYAAVCISSTTNVTSPLPPSQLCT